VHISLEGFRDLAMAVCNINDQHRTQSAPVLAVAHFGGGGVKGARLDSVVTPPPARPASGGAEGVHPEGRNGCWSDWRTRLDTGMSIRAQPPGPTGA
jgi:hypothetical protein